MDKIEIGKSLPNLTVHATSDQIFRLPELKGRNVVLYFYPKDNTPGCTTEGQDFRDHYDDFEALNTVVLGVSRDDLVSHEKFKSKQCFPFDLVTDADGTLCTVFDVIKEKNVNGKKSLGIERSTFLFDTLGVLRKEYRKVKVEGHVLTILKDITELRH